MGYADVRLGVPEQPGTPTLVGAVKVNRRTVINLNEFLDWLNLAADKRNMSYIGVDFSWPLQKQARVLASASLLVASAGSSQFVGFFLRTGASILILPMCVAGASD